MSYTYADRNVNNRYGCVSNDSIFTSNHPSSVLNMGMMAQAPSGHRNAAHHMNSYQYGKGGNDGAGTNNIIEEMEDFDCSMFFQPHPLPPVAIGSNNDQEFNLSASSFDGLFDDEHQSNTVNGESYVHHDHEVPVTMESFYPQASRGHIVHQHSNGAMNPQESMHRVVPQTLPFTNRGNQSEFNTSIDTHLRRNVSLEDEQSSVASTAGGFAASYGCPRNQVGIIHTMPFYHKPGPRSSSNNTNAFRSCMMHNGESSKTRSSSKSYPTNSLKHMLSNSRPSPAAYHGQNLRGPSGRNVKAQEVVSLFNKPSFHIRQNVLNRSESGKVSLGQRTESSARPLKRQKTANASVELTAAIDSVLEDVHDILQSDVLSSPASAGGISLPNTGSLLHITCCRGKNVAPKEIKRLLNMDPKAASRSMVVKTTKVVYNPIRKITAKKSGVNESYTYPLNLAIKHGASPEVLSLLIDTAPYVLICKDGAMKETPLQVLLKYAGKHENDKNDKDSSDKTSDALIATINKMLSMVGDCILSLTDRHMNTPLHVACSAQPSVKVVKYLCALYPPALHVRNFQGKTPLELSRMYTVKCTEAISQYLHEQTYSKE